MKRFIVLLGVLGVSVSSILVRLSTAPSLVLVVYRMGFAAALLVPVVLTRHRGELMALKKREVLLCLMSGVSVLGYGTVNYFTGIGMAVFCILLGHSVFSWGLKYLPPAFISTVKLLEPVFASLLGLLLFGEVPGSLTLLGGAVIIAGIALYSRIEE